MVLCYTTSINVNKTVGEIQAMLAEAGAQAILVEYDGGIPAALSFKAETPHGQLAFRLPSRHVGIYQRLQNSRAPKAKRTEEQAQRVAWRIVRQWVQVQLEFIEAEVAEMEEVFFPFLQNPKDGQTFYRAIKDGKFKGLIAEDSKC